MAKYTSISEIENYMQIDISADMESQVETWIEEASDFIDRKTGTTFDSNTGTTKKYDGNGKQTLYIDDFQSIDTVKVRGNAITDYEANSEKPIYKLYRQAGFPEGFENIEVTGEYGYSSSAPKDIQRACLVFTVGLVDKDGAKESESMEELSVTYKSDKGLSDFKNAVKTVEAYSKND